MRFVLLGFLLSLTTAQVFAAVPETIRVAVAANLSTVILELKRDFESLHPEYRIEPISGSSGKLTAQILAGAPYDLFLSADMDYPEKVFRSGMALAKPESYANTVLLLFTTQDIPVSDGLSVLTNPSVKKIAIANPALAPHGRAAYTVLSNAGLLPHVSNKLIYAENIVIAAQYVAVDAEIGFISLPLLFEKDLAKFRRQGVNYEILDQSLYPKIEQGVVLLKRSEENAAAKSFYDYILSGRARGIFRCYGYR